MLLHHQIVIAPVVDGNIVPIDLDLGEEPGAMPRGENDVGGDERAAADVSRGGYERGGVGISVGGGGVSVDDAGCQVEFVAFHGGLDGVGEEGGDVEEEGELVGDCGVGGGGGGVGGEEAVSAGARGVIGGDFGAAACSSRSGGEGGEVFALEEVERAVGGCGRGGDGGEQDRSSCHCLV